MEELSSYIKKMVKSNKEHIFLTNQISKDYISYYSEECSISI